MMFLKFDKPKSITQIKVFDLLDEADLLELNLLLADNIVILDSTDRTIPGVSGGMESDPIEAKLLRIITYKVKEGKS